MRLSQGLLDAVEAALPGPAEAGVATRAVHQSVGRWNRTTVRHALRELIRQGRAGYSGRDRQRRYRRYAGEGAPFIAPVLPPPPRRAALSWRDYAARGDGSVLIPDADAVKDAMQGLRYRDVDAAALLHEQRMPGWSRRPRNGAELTRAVFGDPAPDRSPPKRKEKA
jgi:hypothetical protein